MPSPAEIQSAAATIERFLHGQPDGADTAENIMRWWATHSPSGAAVELVQEALDHLERMGDVQKASMEGGQMLYQRVRD